MARRIGFGLNVAGNATLSAAAITAITFPVIIGALEARPQSAGQQRAESPEFEVASIRPNREVSDRPTLMRPILQPGGRVLMRNQTLHDLILTAYGVNENQLVGGPAWIRDSSFDLDARGVADMSAETARAMLRTLLAERFSLAVHREQRELPIYVLTVAARAGQLGPRLRQASASCAAATRPQGMPPAPTAPPPKGIVDAILLVAPGAPTRCPSIFRDGHFSGRAVSMDVLAGELSDATGRRVVNRTGLKGEFDLDLIYAADLIDPRLKARDSRDSTEVD